MVMSNGQDDNGCSDIGKYHQPHAMNAGANISVVNHEFQFVVSNTFSRFPRKFYIPDGAALNIVTIHALMIRNTTATGTEIQYTPVHLGAHSKPSIWWQLLTKSGKLEMTEPWYSGRTGNLESLQRSLRFPGLTPATGAYKFVLIAHDMMDEMPPISSDFRFILPNQVDMINLIDNKTLASQNHLPTDVYELTRRFNIRSPYSARTSYG